MTGSCPKHMLLGPCGGVRADGGCEVVADPCVFPVPVQWAGSPVPPVPLRAVPLILTDFSSEPYSVRMLRIVATTLAPSCDAVLVGEHQDRPDFPPALLASLDLPEPPASWRERTAAVERELRRRFGHTSQFAAATGQSHRIGHLIDTGQLTSQLLLLSRE